MEITSMSPRRLIKEILLVLDRIEKESPGIGFLVIKDRMRALLRKGKRDLAAYVKKESTTTVERLTYSYITVVVASDLSSGHFHIYRGVLSPVGKDLLKQFDHANDRLVEMKEMEQQAATNAKSRLREIIGLMG